MEGTYAQQHIRRCHPYLKILLRGYICHHVILYQDPRGECILENVFLLPVNYYYNIHTASNKNRGCQKLMQFGKSSRRRKYKSCHYLEILLWGKNFIASFATKIPSGNMCLKMCGFSSQLILQFSHFIHKKTKERPLPKL